MSLFANLCMCAMTGIEWQQEKPHSLTFDLWNLNKTFPELIMYALTMMTTTKTTMIMMPKIWIYVSLFHVYTSFPSKHPIYFAVWSQKYRLCKHRVLFSTFFLSSFLSFPRRIKISPKNALFFSSLNLFCASVRNREWGRGRETARFKLSIQSRIPIEPCQIFIFKLKHRLKVHTHTNTKVLKCKGKKEFCVWLCEWQRKFKNS